MTTESGYVLASSSPRRLDLCAMADLSVTQVRPDVEEAHFVNSPSETARENARRKISWGAVHHPEAVVIAADTVVSLDDRCVGKPSSTAEAKEFLKRFSGREHEVITAVAVAHPGQLPRIMEEKSVVRFLALSEDAINQYLGSVNPLDKAGGYDINDHGELLISSYKGSFSNIMGLPMERLFTLLWNPPF